MTNATFQTAGDVFDGWRDDVLAGSPPVLFPIGAGDLSRIEIGPGLVTLFGGAPGAGKSAFVMQAVTDSRSCHNPQCVALCDEWQIPIPFGKHKGKPVASLDHEYLAWLLKSGMELNAELRREIERVLKIERAD